MGVTRRGGVRERSALATLSGLDVGWAARKKAEQTTDYDHVLKLTFDELRIVPVVNEMLAGLLALEVRLIAKGYRLPFGTSLLAVARKISH
jgi:hypothetical protein